jgi:hypothetical protein
MIEAIKRVQTKTARKPQSNKSQLITIAFHKPVISNQRKKDHLEITFGDLSAVI